MTTALVQYSTGTTSAEVALLAVKDDRYDRVVLITADTRVEDEDNWRFAIEAWRYLGEPEWTVLADGRTPMQVGRDQHIVPNNRMAVCSQVLKRDLIRKHMDTTYDPAECEALVGYDWSEPERAETARPLWHPWPVRFPLMEPGAPDKRDIIAAWRERGIPEPRLNREGHPHANCGGACVRGGQVEWRRLLFSNRPRYLEWESEEEQTRAMVGKDVSILRDRRSDRDKEGIAMSLKDYRERLEHDPSLFDCDDESGCVKCF